jgi:adenine-specific DNA-methyltransferase
MLNKVFNEDCIETMKRIDSESIDLIVADPPYNIGKDYKNGSDKQSRESYLRFITNQIEGYYRILKPNGSLIIYTGKQFNPYYHIEIEKYMTIQNNIIWFYDSSGVQAKTKYGSLYEPIIYATKHNKKYCFNIEEAQIESYTGSVRKLLDYRKNPPQPYNSKKNCGDVWYFPRVRYRMPEYTPHPTQKPLSICERIIKVHSNEGDLVYIPFGGSGSEIITCIKNNRNFISSELNKDYIDNFINPRILDIQKRF